MRKGVLVLPLLLCPTLARAQPGDSPPLVTETAAAALAAAPVAEAPGDLRAGFYRDERGRLMQVSFDLQQRLWLGAAYAPRRRESGGTEVGPAAFDFGYVQEFHSEDGRTRHRLTVLEGEARLKPFGLDATAFRYDLSHAYDFPLLRITTLWSRPRRHDLTLNVGLYTEALHLVLEPHGEPDNHELTLASVQATLDLWQSHDLRSYVRVRLGPVAHMRFGPWREEARLYSSLPETALEGNFLLGKRKLQQLKFRVRGEWLRTFALAPAQLARDLQLEGQASYEIVLVAINDQPLSLRLAGKLGAREPAGGAGVMAASAAPPPDRTWRPEWSLTAGVRLSFFSPPVLPSPRR